jgi:hypothetical protein
VTFWKPFNLEKSSFTSPQQARTEIREEAKNHPKATLHDLGFSEEGHPIYAVELGTGPLNVSLLAGAHSDEPVGPETLRTMLMQLLSHPNQQAFQNILESFTFYIIPHINPDGEAVNHAWIRQWPDMSAYIEHAFREQPGRDLEFGYPNMRVENRLVSSFLRDYGPYHLHMSLHGMAFSEGLMLLIERNWIDRTQSLRESFRGLADTYKLPLHDHDRGGDKGFRYIGPGFNSTPEGRAMQKHFHEKGDEVTASKFHLSSMEFVRQLGGDPLCLVTELPLYIVHQKNPGPRSDERGYPEAYLSVKEKLPMLRKRRSEGKPVDDLLEPFEIHPLSLTTALRLQFQTLEAALKHIQEKAK